MQVRGDKRWDADDVMLDEPGVDAPRDADKGSTCDGWKEELD